MNNKETFENIIEKIDTYAICSTLNQIVNYIPLKLIESKLSGEKKIEIINITKEIKSERNVKFKRFDNLQWDQNFEYVVKNQINNKKLRIISPTNANSICQKLYFTQDIKYINEKLCLLNEKKILWNITGGQRTTILQIQNFVIKNKRDQDYIIYLEGNANKIICGKFDKNQSCFKYEVLDEKYEVKELNLKTVFNLAGFDISSYDKKGNFLDDNNLDNLEKKRIMAAEHLLKEYTNKNDKYIKSLLRKINKADTGKTKQDKLKYLKVEIENSGKNRDILEYINTICSGENPSVFGCILEYFTIVKLKQAIKQCSLEDYFIELVHSCRVKRAFKSDIIVSENKGDKLCNYNLRNLCEFDVVLLCKSGQVIIFECKSGDMSSNEGKARQYTSYVTSGVYGKPILITPLDKWEIEKVIEQASEGKGRIKTDYDDFSETITAGYRANLDIWGLNELREDKLLELYNEVQE